MDFYLDSWRSFGHLTPLSIALVLAYIYVVFRKA